MTTSVGEETHFGGCARTGVGSIVVIWALYCYRVVVAAVVMVLVPLIATVLAGFVAGCFLFVVRISVDRGRTPQANERFRQGLPSCIVGRVATNRSLSVPGASSDTNPLPVSGSIKTFISRQKESWAALVTFVRKRYHSQPSQWVLVS